jgi:hypothetical protein
VKESRRTRPSAASTATISPIFDKSARIGAHACREQRICFRFLFGCRKPHDFRDLFAIGANRMAFDNCVGTRG